MSAFTQRLFAAIYDPALKASERGSYKSHREYVAGPAHGDVLEIGAGTGANLPYYPEDIRLTVTDPNPFMLRRLTKKATKLEISVETLVAPATDMPFDTQGGLKYIAVALQAMQELDASAADKAKLFEHNARRVFRLP